MKKMFALSMIILVVGLAACDRKQQAAAPAVEPAPAVAATPAASESAAAAAEALEAESSEAAVGGAK